MTHTLKERIDGIADALSPAGEFFKTMARSLSPDRYHPFTKRPFVAALGYLLAVIALATLLMGVLAVPRILALPASIEGALSRFDTLKLTPEFSLTEPLALNLGPVKVVIDTSASGNLSERLSGDAKDADLIVDAGSVYMKRPRCLLAEASCLFLGSEEKYDVYSLAEFSDLLSQKERVSRAVWLWVVYSLPLVYLVLAAYFFLMYAGVALAAAFAAGIALKALKSKVGMGAAFKLAVYALTIPALVGIATLPLKPQLYALHWLVGAGFFCLGLYLAGGGDEIAQGKEKKPFIWKKE